MVANAHRTRDQDRNRPTWVVKAGMTLTRTFVKSSPFI